MYNNSVIPLILFLLSDVFFGQAPSFGRGLIFFKKGQAWVVGGGGRKNIGRWREKGCRGIDSLTGVKFRRY